MRSILAVILALALGLGLGAGNTALAKSDKGKGKHGNYGHSDEKAAEALAVGIITVLEKAIIGDYLKQHGVADFGPPKGLPPGIAKNLARGKPLPPGIAKRYFPYNLLAKLPPRPGYEWVVVDRDILLIAVGTKIIVDILKGAL